LGYLGAVFAEDEIALNKIAEIKIVASVQEKQSQDIITECYF